MFKILFLLFLIVPLVEIAILIQIGQVIGAWPTILLVIVTAAIGAGLFRQQGLSTLSRVQTQLDDGNLPATELVEGVILLVAGAMLLTPGFFTDVLGFLILVPTIRARLATNLLSHFIATRVSVRETENGTIIEGEYREVDDRDRLNGD
ncbi:MAG: FxsA family protein [Gammaproteobacteria bacterium]